jgi:hypothetical protein
VNRISILRKTAEKIAAAVVRYASAGSKEWAEAVASELAYIESDWRALAWALSGMRILLSYQPKPLRTLGDLDAVARKHANSRLHAVNNPWLGRNLLWLLLLLSYAVNTLFDILRGRHVIGNAVLLLGGLLLCRVLYLYFREPKVPDLDDRPGLIRFYVDELSISSSTSSVRFWMSLAGSLLLAAGYGITMSSVWAGFFGIFLLAVFLVRQHCDGKRLAQVPALLSSLPPD